MYRVSTRSLQQLNFSRSVALSRRTRLPSAATFHGSASKLYPRKSPARTEGNDEFDPAAIQELIDKNEHELKDLPELEPYDLFQEDSIKEPQRLAQSEHELFSELPRPGEELPQISPLSSGLDPRKLPVKITSVSDLGPKFTEQDYASALIHGRSIHLPFLHPRTHSVPAGNITFYSHHPRLLALFTHFASHAASSLGIPISKVIMLPTERRLWTVIRSPFVYKKSQENFERKTYKRMIKAWDADPEVFDRWVKYLEKHSMGGVGMRAVKWERLPLGIGKTHLAQLKDAFKVPIPKGVSAEDAKLLEVQGEADSDANRKQVIQLLSKKILKEEMGKVAQDASSPPVAPKSKKSSESPSVKAKSVAAKSNTGEAGKPPASPKAASGPKSSIEKKQSPDAKAAPSPAAKSSLPSTQSSGTLKSDTSKATSEPKPVSDVKAQSQLDIQKATSPPASKAKPDSPKATVSPEKSASLQTTSIPSPSPEKKSPPPALPSSSHSEKKAKGSGQDKSARDLTGQSQKGSNGKSQ